MDCSICLSKIEPEHDVKILSCSHRFHFECYLEMVFRNKNFYIECPLCRSININITKPFSDPFKNIKILCKEGKRCRCKTRDGHICKRKSVVLNYGYCYQHGGEVLTEEYYSLMEKYMYLIFCQRGSFLTKLRLIDLGKKIILKYCDKSSSIDEILEKYYRYFSLNDVFKIGNYDEVYDFYGLEKPENEWIEYCESHNCIL